MKTGLLIHSGGLGDAISFATKFKDFRNKHGIDWLRIQVKPGWNDTHLKILQLYKPIVVELSGLIQEASLRYKFTDIQEKWIQDYSSLGYKMDLPFTWPTDPITEIDLVSKLAVKPNGPNMVGRKIFICQPCTASGNFEGFTAYRYLEQTKWLEILDFVKNLGYFTICLGSEEDRSYLPEKAVELNLCGKLTISETVCLLKKADLFVGCNSFMWEVTAYAGIPTICQYYTNFEKYGPIHLPNMDIPKCGIENLRIELDKNVGKIIDFIKEIKR